MNSRTGNKASRPIDKPARRADPHAGSERFAVNTDMRLMLRSKFVRSGVFDE